MKKISFIFTILLGLMLHTNAQEHVCGTTIDDQYLVEKLSRLAGPSTKPVNRQEGIDIPIKFHIVTKGDGSGGVKQSAIIKQLCKLNQDYSDWNFHFFAVDGIEYNYINNTTAYNDPRTSENFLNGKKVDYAINIFVVGDIGASQGGVGTVLGYYSPSNDLIVCKLAEFNGTSNTLSHEVGHFFSLRHTFFGWECDPYDVAKHGNPVTLTNAPCANVPVEVVARTNCSVAADELCDTPPDYNFGITSLGANCNFSLNLKDRNDDRVIPMKENQMSYFSDCPSYAFTKDQADRMESNYNRANRDYIKTTFMPSTVQLTDRPVWVNPTANVNAPFYNYFDFKWTEVLGADYYLLELEGIDYSFHYTSEPGIILQNLDKNSIYFCTITAFNSGDYCLQSSERVRIITNNQTTATNDAGIFNGISVFPNPATSRINIRIDVEQSTFGTISIIDLSGKKVLKSNIQFSAGTSLHTLDILGLASGVYTVNVESTLGTIKEKLVIIK